MSEGRQQRRLNILYKLLKNNANNYEIKLMDSFIYARNYCTGHNFYTDDLQAMKKWLTKDMKQAQKESTK